jgi:6-phosphogluconolactonase (cycloisomerase 2 family)
MTKTARIPAALFSMVALGIALAGCNGSTHDEGSPTPAPAPVPAPAPPPPPPGGVGPAGGSVSGPYGALVTVPAGALSSNVDIVVARDLSSAPDLSASDVDTAGAGFALTPHGTGFAQAATVQVPFDSDRIPTDATPALYKAEPGGAFAPITTTLGSNGLVANVSNFSWVIPGFASTRPRVVYALISDNSMLKVASFKIGKTDGTLSGPTSTAVAGTGANSVTIHPSRRFAYVTNGTSGVPGSATNVSVNSISVYALDATTGALSGPIDTKPANANPIGAVVHPTGKFVYVVNEVRFGALLGNVSVYSIDATTGALTPQGTTADLGGTPATAIAFSPSGRFAYVTYIPAPGVLQDFDTVKTYSVDAGTGLLSGPIGSAATGDIPWAIAVTPGGKFAYVASLGTQGSVNDVAIYSINATSGILTLRSSFFLGGKPASLAMDSEGRFLYVARQQVDNNQNLFVFSIDATSGALTQTTSLLTSNGSGPIAVVAEPQGQFVYATGDRGIIPYFLSPSSGSLSAGPPVSAGGGGGTGVGDPFSFAAGGTSPVWVNGCTIIADNFFVFQGCPLASSVGSSTGGSAGSTAVAQSPTHQLDVSAGVLGGVITSTPAGIDYNSDGPQNKINAAFTTGTTVQLCGAKPATSNQVVDFKWTGSGGCSGSATCTFVTMSADRSCHLELTVRPPG